MLTGIQKIMEGLKLKAHVSLQEFREGKLSPAPGGMLFKNQYETASPDADSEDDELSKLGGKTRLISQKEFSKSPSPSLATRSPNSQHPIVPLPLAGDAGLDNPMVREYLQTFAYAPSALGGLHSAGAPPQAQPQSSMYTHAAHNGAVYGAGPSAPAHAVYMGGSAPVTPYLSHVHDHSHSLSSTAAASPTSSSGAEDMRLIMQPGTQMTPSTESSHSGSAPDTSYFPQYFPVFDYGPAGGQAAYAPLQIQQPVHGGMAPFEHDHTMHYNGHAGMNGAHANGYVNGQRGARESMTPPEGGIHTTWMDFVEQMSL